MNTVPKAHDLLGAIDAGSNAIRFSVYRLSTRLTPVIHFRKRFPVKLGAGTFTSGDLSDVDMDAAISAFQEIAHASHEHNLIALPAVATSAIREAGNCDAFLARVKTETGIDLRAINGDEEARLAARGVAATTNSKHENLIIDIGGGSTEIIRVKPGGEVAGSKSLELGAVRLAEHFKMPDSYSADALEEMRKMIQQTLSVSSLEEFKSPSNTTCIGGTACALAHAANSRKTSEFADKLKSVDIADATADLENLSVNVISRTIGVDNNRAGLIITGGYILTALLAHLRIQEFIVSDAGVREGLVSEYLEKTLLSEPS